MKRFHWDIVDFVVYLLKTNGKVLITYGILLSISVSSTLIYLVKVFDKVQLKDAGFGSPTSRAQGKGWVTELLARIQKRTPAPYDSTTNSTLDENEYTFPLDQNLYVDFSHDTVIANIVSTLNLTQFSSHLPNNKIPRESKHITRWHTSHIVRFVSFLLSNPLIKKIFRHHLRAI